MIRVLVFNEFRHENIKPEVREIYPDGIHGCIAEFLACEDISVKTVTLCGEDGEVKDPTCGITKELLDETDVIIWWAHVRHQYVSDEVAALVRDAVHEGMGAIFLHSGHHSKPFKLLMGTPCNLCWRESGDSERVWVIDPTHPITKGIDRVIFFPHEETYGEPFSIPEPNQLLMIGSYSGGEAFRSGCLFKRGNGKIFYFQPGHETFPIFHMPEVQTVIKNAVRYLAPAYREPQTCPHVRTLGDPEGYVIKK